MGTLGARSCNYVVSRFHCASGQLPWGLALPLEAPVVVRAIEVSFET